MLRHSDSSIGVAKYKLRNRSISWRISCFEDRSSFDVPVSDFIHVCQISRRVTQHY